MYKQKEDIWVVYFIRKNIHTVLPSTIKKYNYKESWVKFNGFVYCVSVPNQVIYVRRNGIPVWCGNSDPPMNWRISSLDKYNLVSFSDNHSFWPWRLSREATIFDCDMSYDSILKAIRTGEGLKGTIEVKPEYGKYHWDGHRKCGVHLNPFESKKIKGICPVCGRPLTLGVDYRVEELADRKTGFVRENAKEFIDVLPLTELIAYNEKIIGLGSVKVWKVYNDLISKFGNEYNILFNVPKSELSDVCGEKLSRIILLNRNMKLKIKPGYDGVYGEIVEQDFVVSNPNEKVQKSLGDF